jgi:hypothetical protein
VCPAPRIRFLAIPSAVDPPSGERAGSGAAMTHQPGTITINAGGPGAGLLGLPGSMVGGMAVHHPGAGAASAGGALQIWSSRERGALTCGSTCGIMPHVEPYPEDSDRRQGLTKTAEIGLSAVPVVGSALQIALNDLAGRRLAERRTRWLNDLAAKVYQLEEQIGDFARLTNEDAFMDALTTAAQIADRTSRIEKLEALRNAVVNSVTPDAPDLDTQQLFFDMIDRFTPTHVRMLKLLSDPPGWFERSGIPRPNISVGPKAAIIEAGMPELAGRRDLIDRYAGPLTTAGLINQALTGMLSSSGLWASGTTPLAAEFLAFIADPESKVD